MPPFPERIDTKRLVLRPPRPSDAKAVCDAVQASYAELHEWMAWAKEPYGMADAAGFCAASEQRFRDGEELPMLLLRKWTRRIVGAAGLIDIEPNVPSCEIGYWLRTDRTGRGYAAEAARALARYAFDSLGAKRVQIRMDDRNERSWRVAERLGFHWEATLRAHRRNNADQLCDTRVYAMFAVEDLR